MKLNRVGFHDIDMSLMPDEISKLPRARRRLMEIMMKGSTANVDEALKSWSLDFCLSPTEFLGRPDRSLESTVFERTLLSSPFDPSSSVASTTEKLTIPSSVAFRSIGYKSVALPGFDEAGISFNDRKGIIDNDGMGRVLQINKDESSGSHLPGVYCAGWVKRGPTGVIASTMEDAFSTGDAIASDWNSAAPFIKGESSSGWEALRAGVEHGKCKVITWEDWQKIDKAEKERGLLAGKEREKFTSTKEMLAAAS